MENKQKHFGHSIDAMLLTVVKLFTTLTSIISTMILSKELTLALYGTYSQGNLIVTSVTAITVLGLMDASNYFFNKTDSSQTKKEYMNTCFFIEGFTGISAGIIICLSSGVFVDYFDNPLLYGVIVYVAFRPVVNNFIGMYQVLQVAIGKAKSIAVRNAIISFSKVIIIMISVYVTNNIATIFAAYLVVDIITLAYFAYVFSTFAFVINPFRPILKLIKPILGFSIPMSLYIITNTLARDTDKYIIGLLGSTEEMAIYTNSATQLPFDIISNSFLIIIIPIITRYISQGKNKECCEVYKRFLQISYITISTFAFATGICSNEVIRILYDVKYLPGRTVFLLFLLVDILKFANISLILSAKGKTKQLMVISFCGLFANLVLSLLFYKLFGFVGPAITTVLITFAISLIMLKSSAKALRAKISFLIDYYSLFGFFIKLIICGGIMVVCKLILVKYIDSPFIIILLIGGGLIVTSTTLNWGVLKTCFAFINNITKNDG